MSAAGATFASSRYDLYFSALGSPVFARTMAERCPVVAVPSIGLEIALSLPESEVLAAASKHGNIGQKNRAILDAHAVSEQGRVAIEGPIVDALIAEGEAYQAKFGVKFLVSAKDKTAEELLAILRERAANSRDVEWHNARNALWEIARKRLSLEESPLAETFDVGRRLLDKYRVQSFVATVHAPGLPPQFIGEHKDDAAISDLPETLYEIASLSKTLASAMCLEYLAANGISLDESANKLFERTTSSFRIRRASLETAGAEEWSGDDVTVAHLLSHHAINMHYVNGVPANREMPPIAAFLNGNETYGYVPVAAIAKPGTEFHYSGGGFIVMEHLLEALSGKSIHEHAAVFFEKLGMHNTTFKQWTLEGKKYAVGLLDDGVTQVEGGRLMFPAFAAGAMSTTKDVMIFLEHLTEAYSNWEGAANGALSHDTARRMLHGFDHGCRQFMGCLMGIGVFVGEAGSNKVAIHQGANNGFRSIFVHVFDGPNRGAGFCIACNSELRAVALVAELSQVLLRSLTMQGVDFSKFKASFSPDHVKPEEVVNTGYRELIFNAFCPSRPEEIVRTEASRKHPHADANLLTDGTVIFCSNDRFARCENIFSPYEPEFDPALFGKQGKIMDSWETVRHNPMPCDAMTVVLKKTIVSPPRFVEVSTKYHLGNQAPYIRILGFSTLEAARNYGCDTSRICSPTASVGHGVVELLPVTSLQGHSLLRVDLGEAQSASFPSLVAVAILNIPDGGISRVALFQAPPRIPADYAELFPVVPRSERFTESIPKTVKPLVAPFTASADDIVKHVEEAVRNLKASSSKINVASAALGASVLMASDEHYSPAVQVISPLPPLNMFDGLESARSRVAGSFEFVKIKLAWPCIVERVHLDFTYFVNNNPKEVELLWAASPSSVLGGSSPSDEASRWQVLVPRCNVKAFAASVKVFHVPAATVSGGLVAELQLRTFPCGGVNRVQVFTSTLPPSS